MSNGAWQPSRPVALLLGIASLWPPVYFVIFFTFLILTFVGMESKSAHVAAGFPIAFGIFFVAHLLTMLMMMGLLIAFIVHAFKTDLIPQDKKVLWVVILFFGGLVACPIYWYLYVWRPLRPPA